MASNILTTDIDELYPVAGSDNDSQGFRDNFRLVKTGLATAASEITDLETTRAKLNASNDFNGNVIREANFVANTEEAYGPIEVSSSQNLRFVNGHYQLITVKADVTLTLVDWPETGKLGKIRCAVKGDGTSRLVVFDAGANRVLKTDTAWPDSFLAISETDPIFIDLWSSDGGLTVYGQYQGQFTV